MSSFRRESCLIPRITVTSQYVLHSQLMLVCSCNRVDHCMEFVPCRTEDYTTTFVVESPNRDNTNACGCTKRRERQKDVPREARPTRRIADQAQTAMQSDIGSTLPIEATPVITAQLRSHRECGYSYMCMCACPCTYTPCECVYMSTYTISLSLNTQVNDPSLLEYTGHL